MSIKSGGNIRGIVTIKMPQFVTKIQIWVRFGRLLMFRRALSVFEITMCRLGLLYAF